MKEPKVLVISHNVFSASGNMGKTMVDMLSGIPAENLAQLYFHSEVPTLKMCKRYFRITDRNMLKSVLSRKGQYHIYREEDICENRGSSRTDSGMTAKVYQYSRRRTPLIYFARNTMWKLGVWNSNALNHWIQEFSPDVIFFASGDYSFAYRIVYKIAKRYHIPVVMWCCDDHYISRKKKASPMYHYVKNDLIKWAHRAADLSRCLITISDKMQQDYSALFGKQAEVIRISAKENPERVPVEEKSRIVYAGNLGVNRLEPLLELGRQLTKAGMTEYPWIDVYSGERDPKRLELLTKENGINFHGAVSQEELGRILGSAKYLLHVEAFDEDSMKRTRYSLSTKIGESLQSGACIVAYGPKDISSMEYLIEHDAAVFLSRPEDLISLLKKFDEEKETYKGYVERAVRLAEECHNKKLNDEKMRKALSAE